MESKNWGLKNEQMFGIMVVSLPDATVWNRGVHNYGLQGTYYQAARKNQ